MLGEEILSSSPLTTPYPGGVKFRAVVVGEQATPSCLQGTWGSGSWHPISSLYFTFLMMIQIVPRVNQLLLEDPHLLPSLISFATQNICYLHPQQ